MLVSSDLQARVRAERAAGQVGMEVETRRPDRLEALDVRPALVILDLDQISDAAGWMRAADPGPTRVVGFFSHVQRDAGEAAAAAGVEVHRRGRFWKELGDLLAELR